MTVAFVEWYKRQFGRRPTTIDPARLKYQLQDARREVGRLEELQARADTWDEQHRAARYAWNTAKGRQAGDDG